MNDRVIIFNNRGFVIQRNTAFYISRAEHHGRMTAYYVDNLRIGRDNFQDWDLDQAPIEAAEAWHFASLLTDEEIESVLVQRRVEENDHPGF
jgi:hypothetical protein